MKGVGLWHEIAHGKWLQKLEEKSGTYIHPPSSQGIFGNVDGRRCTAMTMHNLDCHPRTPMMWREAGGRKKSPRAAEKKSYKHEDMIEGILYPWLLSLKNYVWGLPKIPPPAQNQWQMTILK